MKHGYLKCTIDGTNLIVLDTIIGKIPLEGTDSYDYIILDNFVEIDTSKEYIIEEYVPCNYSIDEEFHLFN